MCFLQWGSWFSCSFHIYSSMDKGFKLLHCRWLEAMVCKRPSGRVSLKRHINVLKIGLNWWVELVEPKTNQSASWLDSSCIVVPLNWSELQSNQVERNLTVGPLLFICLHFFNTFTFFIYLSSYWTNWTITSRFHQFDLRSNFLNIAS